MKKLDAALARLKRGAVELVSEADLRERLAAGRPLRVKLGVDPTSRDLHLGHTVALSKLRAFQDLGHTAVLIIGDFTAQVGDPSGRDATRPSLTFEAIEQNAETYKEQAFKVLDPEKTEIRYNSQWLAGIFRVERAIEAGSVLQRLLTRYSVLRLLEREEFKKRREAELPITLAEILYPLFQAYDSVAVKADVELGGNDQLFNLLMGRTLQADFGQKPQVCLTTPLLVGTDGVKKMSKSYDNTIAVKDEPGEMFGKVMRLSDALMLNYYELLSDRDLKAVKAAHPMAAKKALGEELVARFHDAAAARQAREGFERVFSKRETPEEVPAYRLPAGAKLVDVMVDSGVAPSKNEARRLLQQGGVKLDGETVKADRALDLPKETLLQVGKRHFRRLLPVGNKGSTGEG